MKIDHTLYDRILVAFSGGKDSLACVLHLLDIGVPRWKIELHHHDVDGGARAFMDWTITPGYCRAIAAALGIKLYFSYKVGGFEREMLRDQSRTAPMRWETVTGEWREMGGTRGNESTRRKFPQVSADLSVRWCSAYLKIDVMSAMIRNEDRFLVGKTLVLTGERAQESAARAKYAEFEPDRTDNRNGKLVPRHVDRWRPVLQWSEADVWAIIKRYGIVPHPAYQLGWGRLSCMTCIFGSPNQWATIRAIFPDRFAAVEAREAEFGVTIKRGATITQLADRGTPYAASNNADLVRLANAEEWEGPILVDDWQLPAGAFGESVGPT
jgi:3'-phosphoadenosine 5'-phosphosulfate sulfotransferase (PAPS reductase)/FAD synthetase